MQESKETRQEAIDKILLIMGDYYQQTLTEDVIDIYHRLWAGYPVEDVAAACEIWMKCNRWHPMVNQIIDILETRQGPSLQTRAQVQWRVILQQIPKHGMYHPPRFSDPITANLVKSQFSWSYLCSMEESELNWEQKRWCEAFELAAELFEDLVQLEVPEEVGELLNTVGRKVTGTEEPEQKVPLEKITKFRKMLEAQAALDEKDLDKTNARINLSNNE